MGENSKIEWCHHTFNPCRGCTKISPGCAHCYAERDSNRNPKILGVWGDSGTRVVASESMWTNPPKWDRAAREAGERHRVFCASLADVFEGWRGYVKDAHGDHLWDTPGGWVPTDMKLGVRMVTLDHVRRRLAKLIDDTPNLDWLLLTKRPENAARMIYEMWFPDAHWPKNYWLGVSVEDRKHGLPRIDVLRTIPAEVRFLSIEPLLEDLGPIDLTGIHWVIVGGESGPHARPMNPRWARSIRDQCQSASVPFFFKQWGEWAPANMAGPDAVFDRTPQCEFDAENVVWHVKKKAAGRLLGGQLWSEFPESPSHA